jgi:hypothetical protein
MGLTGAITLPSTYWRYGLELCKFKSSKLLETEDEMYMGWGWSRNQL